MLRSSRYFHIYESGPVPVIGFDARHLKDPTVAEACRQDLQELTHADHGEILAIDMTDAGLLPSWLLGVLATVQAGGVDVMLYHPSAEVRDVLAMTQLDAVLKVRHEEIAAARPQPQFAS